MTVICKCRVCGLEFGMTGLIGGSANIVMKGNSTTCLKCGALADILDGTYKMRDSRIEEISGPALTIEIARRLGVIVDKAKRQPDLLASELVAEIADVSPELAAKIAKRGWGIWALLLLLIWLIKSVELNVSLDVNRLIDQLEVMEQKSESVDTNFNEYPIPEDAIIDSSATQTIVAAPIGLLPNRKERRRKAMMLKRHKKHNA